MKIPIQAIENYLAGTASESEKKLVNDWYLSFDDEAVELTQYDHSFREKIRARMHHRLQAEIQAQSPIYSYSRKRTRFLAAAIFAGAVVCTGIYLFLKNSSSKETPVAKAGRLRADVLPGDNKATLTLADGTVMPLGGSAKGATAQQGSTQLIFLDSGKLAYKAQAKNTEVFYNTVTTPRGGQYQLILPDGTKVWLNASSSLRFPTAFPGRERNVVLTGEAYFEVARNKDKPFHVAARDMQIEVLGTHFNVMSYNNESTIKTTLLEGAVKILTGNANALLKPGQQATVNSQTAQIKVDAADIDEAVAWKNGLFQFNGDDVGTIMRQLERWYDLEIAYGGKIPGWRFTGSISRDVPLSQVLKMFEVNDLHFKVNGNKITVLQ